MATLTDATLLAPAEWRALEEVQRPGGPDLESQLRDEATGPTARRAEGA